MEELHEYEYLLSSILELFLNDTFFQQSIENFLGDEKTTFEITMLFQKLIGLMNDIKENQLKLSLEIFTLETENCYTEYGLDSIEKKYLTTDVNSGDFSFRTNTEN